MPFIFNANDFAQPQPSPLQQIFGTMFGTAAQQLPQAFQDARQEKQFQQQLGLRQQELDLRRQEQQQEQQNYQQRHQEEQQARQSAAGALAPQMVPWGQVPTPQGGVSGTLNSLGKYQQDHQSRVQQMQQLLQGLDPSHQAALFGIYQQKENEAKHQAFSQHAADTIEQQINALTRRTQGSMKDPNAGADPQLEAMRQQSMLLGQGYIQALRSGDPKVDPEKLLQQFSTLEAAMNTMEKAHSQALSQHSAYSALHENTKQRLVDVLAQQAQGVPIEDGYINFLQQQVDTEQGLLSDRLTNLDMPQKDWEAEWGRAHKNWWSPTHSKVDPTDRALQEVDKHMGRLKDQFGMVKAMLDADPENPELKSRLKGLLGQVDELNATRDHILSGQDGAEQGPPAQPTSQAPQADQISQKLAERIALDKVPPEQAFSEAIAAGVPEQTLRPLMAQIRRQALDLSKNVSETVPGQGQTAKQLAEQESNVNQVRSEYETNIRAQRKLGPQKGLLYNAPQTEADFKRAYQGLAKQLEVAKQWQQGERHKKLTTPDVDDRSDIEYVGKLQSAMKALLQLGQYNGWSTPTVREMYTASRE